MTELVENGGHSVALSCRLFGRCRQAWYQSKSDIAAEVERDSRLLSNVREIREVDPRIGGHKLWLMLCDIYGRDKMMGRDSFLHPASPSRSDASSSQGTVHHEFQSPLPQVEKSDQGFCPYGSQPALGG